MSKECPYCKVKYTKYIEGIEDNPSILYITECKHKMCLGCFDKFSDTTNQCPCCKKSLIDSDF